MSIIVIPCGKAKQSLPAAAKDLYTGTSFRLARAAAQADGREWMILSSRYGLVPPDRVLPPYEAVTKTDEDSRRLGRLIASQIARGLSVESWCPRAYTTALILGGADLVADPLRGMRQGERAHWFKEHTS